LLNSAQMPALGSKSALVVLKTVLDDLQGRARALIRAMNAQEADAVLYALSALFAAITIRTSTIALYRQWGELAIGPYIVAALGSGVFGYRTRRRYRAQGKRAYEVEGPDGLGGRAVRGLHIGPARAWMLLVVLVGSTLVPLALEVAWRTEGNASNHVQPEVVVVEQAAQREVHGQDPYHTSVDHGHVVAADPGLPTYESFFPYLPLMTVFGLPSATGASPRLSDGRLFFMVFTIAVVWAALAICRGPSGAKVRILQVLTVLPTAALPLATGGDDMAVVGLLLLAMVLAQRRRPGLAGIALGVASAMKFTAWPLALLALFAARDRSGRRAPARMALGIALVAGPVVLPFMVENAHAFVDNVVLFPLGLVGVASPAATPMPGHILVSLFPSLHRIWPILVGVIGGVVLIRYLIRKPPATAGAVVKLAAWVMTIAILCAPATRLGYLLYPINFFIWAYLLNRSEDPVVTSGIEPSTPPLLFEVGAVSAEGPRSSLSARGGREASTPSSAG
jgi:Glycosyltransferase family 87